MVDENGTNNEEATGRKSTEEASPAREVSTSVMLAGAEKRFDDKVHIGIAIRVTSSGKPSTLMILTSQASRMVNLYLSPGQ